MNRALYTWLLRLAIPYVCLRLFWRGLKNRDYWRRLPERLGFTPAPLVPGAIWVHAVSVGEVRAAAPLVRALRAHHALVLTAMTPTGVATARALFGDDVTCGYVPYDYPSAVNRFLDRVRPSLVVILEKELWPNLVYYAHTRGIPVCVANAQLGTSSLRGWQRASRLAGATFGVVNAFAVQTEDDARRLLAAGARPEVLHVVGSIKFDLALPEELPAHAQGLRQGLGAGRPIWVAASTHEGEEEAVLAAHAKLKQKFSDVLLVLVPRHPERFDSVVRLCERAGFVTARRSRMPQALPVSTDVLVGDSMGELQLFYGVSDVAFIGGSLVPAGGHNFIEAAAVGVPAVFGPDMRNIEEIARQAVACGAAVQIVRSEQLADAISDFLNDASRRVGAGAAGRRLVEENRGALARTLALIEKLLAR